MNINHILKQQQQERQKNKKEFIFQKIKENRENNHNKNVNIINQVRENTVNKCIKPEYKINTNIQNNINVPIKKTPEHCFGLQKKKNYDTLLKNTSNETVEKIININNNSHHRYKNDMNTINEYMKILNEIKDKKIKSEAMIGDVFRVPTAEKPAFQFTCQEDDLNNREGNAMKYYTDNPVYNENLNKFIASLNDTDVYVVLNPDIKCIHNNFQYKYGNVVTNGIGDYIRGCYFLIQFCENWNILCEFHINQHPLNEYFHYFHNNEIGVPEIVQNVKHFEHTNHNPYINNNNKIYSLPDVNIYNQFIHFLNQLPVIEGNVYINNISFPLYEIVNIQREKVRAMFAPHLEIQNKATLYLEKIQFQPHKYKTFHLRLGDKYLNENDSKLPVKIIQKIIQRIKNIYKPGISYMIISDNNYIKPFIRDQFPQIQYINYPIVHTSSKHCSEGIENTVLDYIFLSWSNEIYSYSVYPHGSGFSKWCAVTYNIPYTCEYIGLDK